MCYIPLEVLDLKRVEFADVIGTPLLYLFFGSFLNIIKIPLRMQTTIFTCVNDY